MGAMKKLAAETALVESKELVIRPNKRRHKAISTLGKYRRVKKRRKTVGKQTQTAAEARKQSGRTEPAFVGRKA